MGLQSPSLRFLALLLPFVAIASPLITTTVEVEGTPLVVIDQVISTVTVHDGAATACAANYGISSGTAEVEVNGNGGASGLGSGTATTVINGGGNTIDSGPYSTATGPVPDATVLAPAIHPDVDPSDVVNIQLTNTASLFYSDPNPVSADVSVAFVTIPQMNYQTVVLDHSSLITNLTCNGNSMSLDFATEEAFNTAQANWTANSFVIITSNSGCASTTGQHDYILVDNVSFSGPGLSATLATSYINITQAVGISNPVTVELGNYTLSQGNGSTGFATGPVGGANSTTISTTNSSTPASPDFDVSLDQSIGFLDVDDDTYWSQLYPGVTGETYSDFAGEDTGPVLPADAEKRRRFRKSRNASQLNRRGWWDSVVDFYDDVTDTLIDVVEDTVSVLVDTAGEIAAAAVEVYDTLNPFTPHTFTPIDDDLAFATPQGTDSTPWGAGEQLYSQAQDSGSIAIYCVGCGASGTIHVKGTITFIVGELSLTGSLNAAGDIHAALELGIVASYNNNWSYDKEIANVPLSPLSIPGVLTIGPQIVVSAGGSLTVTADGQLLAGATLDWPAVQFNIDITSPGSSTASGFTPDLNPVFDAKGSVSATADAYLKVSVGFGIDILDGVISKQVALVEKPDLSITAAAAGSASLSDGSVTGTIGTGSCDGVSLNVDFNNYVYADLLGSEININTLSLPVFDKCVTLSKRRSLTASDAAHAVEPTAHNPKAPRAFTVDPLNMTVPTVNYTVLNTADGSLEIHWADNGNLYAIGSNTSTASGVDDSILFSATDGGKVVGDSDGRLFHGYVDTLANLGVSRLRLADADNLPITSVMLTLAPVPLKDNSAVMLAFDTAGNPYYPLLCVYDNLYPKIFIAKDVEAGSAALEDAANVGTLTGGSVKECGFFSFGN